MSVKKFILELDIGNDAVLLPTHVSAILQKISLQVPHVIMSKGITTKVKDSNGNTIGSWTYK